MSEYNRLLLDASTTDVPWGTPIDVTGLRNVFFEVWTEVTAATLQANMQFTQGIELGARYDNPSNGVTVTTPPAGITFNGLTVTWSNPGIGTSRFVVRYPNPPRYISPYYDYTSGGGAVRIRVTGWGFGVSTTP